MSKYFNINRATLIYCYDDAMLHKLQFCKNGTTLYL